MKYQGLWSRWHRFNEHGTKYIKRFGIDEIPEPLIEHGYTEWRRGTGPLTDQHYDNVVRAIRAFSTGVPKSENTKYKMRLAKLGVPKTMEHRKSMSEAWKRKRLEKYRNVLQGTGTKE